MNNKKPSMVTCLSKRNAKICLTMLGSPLTPNFALENNLYKNQTSDHTTPMITYPTFPTSTPLFPSLAPQFLPPVKSPKNTKQTGEVELYHGDCVKVLKKLQANSIDLIVTSPPYADQRKDTYGGVHPDDYVAWFLPKTAEFLRVLKPTGTFILNIKEKVSEGERHTYVMELILEMRKQGWLWTEEFIWHKKNCYPGKWPNRFRDAWERCLQFNKTKKFKMLQDEVRVPMGDWAKTRLKTLGDNDTVRFDSQVGNGFGKNIANWVGRDLAYPSNVLHLATECGNKKHSAAFPKALPEWFIKLFTEEGDTVLDPFLGSGTTCEAARDLKRNSVGIELHPDYFKIACENLSLQHPSKA